MKELKINETPLRTSKSFYINNINLENIEIPTKLKEFKNVKVICKNRLKDKCKIKLTYGISSFFEEQEDNNNLNLKVDEPDEITIIYTFDENNTELVNKINIEANSNANITVVYKSSTNLKCFHNGIIKIIANKNANVDISVVNLLNENSDNFEAFENEINDDSQINYCIVDLGNKNSIQNYYANLIGKNSKNNLKTIYLAANKEIKDLNYIVHLRGEKSNVDIDVQGAVNDESTKHFKGTIDFKKGCKKAKGNENEYCLSLSKNAKAIALPMLLCSEDDVEGNHSTACGKIAPQELFYIMSRGIQYKDAVKLIVKARFNNIVEEIKNEVLKNEVLEQIDRRLS